jgi:predicted hydrocarbon binding protein
MYDRASPTTLGQREENPICYVTLGMLQACLSWATGVDYDIEEIACRGCGDEACAFKIHT